MHDVRALRRRLNLTQAQLADRLGIDQASVSRLERGHWEAKGPVAILLQQLEAEAAAVPEPARSPDAEAGQAAA